MIDHRPEFEKDMHYQKGDRIYAAPDPEGHDALGVKRMQSLYGIWKKSGNVGKMKVDGKNCVNVDAILRWKKEQPARAPRKTSSTPRQAKATVGKETRLQGVNWQPNSIQGGQKQEIEITPEHIHNSQEAGRFLLWSRLVNMYPSSFGFGTLKKVSTDVVSYVSDLDLTVVDSINGFIQDIAKKRILIVKPHEALSFISVQLLMAAKENDDVELEQFVAGVLEPACQYLKDRFDTELGEKKEKYGPIISNDVVGEAEPTPKALFDHADEIDEDFVRPDQREGYNPLPEEVDDE